MSRSKAALVYLLVALFPTIAVASPSGRGGRDFDARPDRPAVAPAPAQLQAEQRLSSSVPELMVRYDGTTGAARTVSSAVGPLTAPTSATPLDAGLGFVRANLDLFGLGEADLTGFEIADDVPSALSGARHLYLTQTHEGLPVYNAQLHLNVMVDGRILSVNSSFVPALAGAVDGSTPALSAAQAVQAFAAHLGTDADPAVLSPPSGPRSLTRLDDAGLSRSPIDARLAWLPVAAGDVRLVWNFQVETLDGEHWFDATVDAGDGTVWTRFDWIDDADYRVYPQPVESPDHTTPAPPADARVLLTDPHDTTASPFGWHDTDGVAGAEFTIHRGNNVHAWEDSDGNDLPPAGPEPDCLGTLACDFPLDLTMAPSTYRPAAVTNLFYWNNVIHDVLHYYGFDAESGNFQVDQYGAVGGVGGDDVRALAQSGLGNCNANFFTPPDGQRPRMRMFTCTNASPAHDGDLDAMVIVHEYGHGISNRLVGGPGIVNCLQNTQQPGEGWSDWYGLAFTAEAGDVGTDPRGVGTYLFGQPPTGPGIRPQRYSTDPLVNTYTYESIDGLAVPHGLGSVWAQAAWEVYWALVDEYGFDTDIYDATGGSGNQRALLYVTEGLKDTACGPTFLDTRDGIIQAAMDNYGGDDVCLIWQAFADFGLGVDATTPGPNSTEATNGFALPGVCSFFEVPAAEQVICTGDDAMYDITVGEAFAPPVTLSVSGEPAGTTTMFSVNPVNSVPDTTTLTVSNTGGAAPGSYTLTVEATDAAPVTESVMVDLDVLDAAPGATSLSTPPDGATAVPTAPTLTWSAVADATEYFVEIAADAGFGTVVDSATVAGTSYTAGVHLAALTEYFWRVTAINPCGSAAASPTFSFTTNDLFCSAPGVIIPDGPVTGVDDTISIPEGGFITDLDVSIRATHGWVGDMVFTLTHVETGASATIYDQPGVPISQFGCAGDNVDATLDDEAADPVEDECGAGIPTINGSFSPNNPLSVFDGHGVAGTWVMTAADVAADFPGTFDEWCIAAAADFGGAIFADGFETGDTALWSLSVGD
jgi:extracellular elastinolytic metalloproteinase